MRQHGPTPVRSNRCAKHDAPFPCLICDTDDMGPHILVWMLGIFGLTALIVFFLLALFGP